MDYSIRRSGLAVPANRVFKSDGWGQITNNDIDASAAIAYTKLNLANSILSGDIANGTIMNEDISPSAAITYGKLNLVNSILNADINASAAIAYSKLNLAGSITSGDIADNTIMNADVNGSAAIALSKLAHVGTGNVLKSNGTNNVAGQITSADITDGTITTTDLASEAASQMKYKTPIFGMTLDQVITSGASVDMANMELTLTPVANSKIFIFMVSMVVSSDAGVLGSVSLTVNGAGSGSADPYFFHTHATANRGSMIAALWVLESLPATSHIFRTQAYVSSGTLTLYNRARGMVAWEVKR